MKNKKVLGYYCILVTCYTNIYIYIFQRLNKYCSVNILWKISTLFSLQFIVDKFSFWVLLQIDSCGSEFSFFTFTIHNGDKVIYINMFFFVSTKFRLPEITVSFCSHKTGRVKIKSCTYADCVAEIGLTDEVAGGLNNWLLSWKHASFE